MRQDEPDFITLARGICPNCDGVKFSPGPRGGLSQNIECRNCLRRFNVAVFRGELVFAQRIESKAEGGFSWDGKNYVMSDFPPRKKDAR
jgi:hypothetical protein